MNLRKAVWNVKHTWREIRYRVHIELKHLNWNEVLNGDVENTWALGVIIHKHYVSLWLGPHELCLSFYIRSRANWMSYELDLIEEAIQKWRAENHAEDATAYEKYMDADMDYLFPGDSDLDDLADEDDTEEDTKYPDGWEEA